MRSSAISDSGEAHLAELERRIERNGLTPQQRRRVIAMLLDYQADSSKPWSPLMGRLLEHFHDTKQLDEGDWRRYLTNGVETTLECPSVVGTNGADVGSIWLRGRRYGRFHGDVRINIDEIRFQRALHGGSAVATEALAPWTSMIVPLGTADSLKPGEQELMVRYTLAISDGALTAIRSFEHQTSFLARDKSAEGQQSLILFDPLEKDAEKLFDWSSHEFSAIPRPKYPQPVPEIKTATSQPSMPPLEPVTSETRFFEIDLLR